MTQGEKLAARSHCANGHPLTGANLRMRKRVRVCKTCKAAADKRKNERRSQRRTDARRGLTIEKVRDLAKQHLQLRIAFPSAGPGVDRSGKRRKSAQLRAFVDSLKREPCTDCGGRFHPCAMDFDHLDGHTKVASISHLVDRGKSKQRILDEIAKCDLVCSNCHRVRTFTRGQHKHRSCHPRVWAATTAP